MAVVFEKPKALTDAVFHYCPGCTHGIIHRLVAEAIDTLGIEGRTIGIAPVGCSVLAYDYFTCDMVEASHGRAPAVATGVKRSLPDNIVFTYQGDGDLASIGLCETVSAAARGENITVIFVNNAIYGMTGGQMAPTSLPGQITQTSPYGRDVNTCGWPIRICEMLATLEAPAYLERVTVNNVKNVKNAKKAIEKAFRYQVEGKGFSLIEVLSACPTNWGLTPQKALEWIDEKMIRSLPDNIVFTYQGDGDLASIGLCETVSAAARGENITVIFVNNAIYGMTGGQMAPTSLPGQITQTSPYGRDVNTCGWPIRICEMLATLEAPAYLERVTVNNVKNVKNAKKAIEKAFRYQVEGKGFSLIEVLSACPTNWGLTPQKALEWIDEKMIPYYPLGVYRDKEG